MNQTHIVSVVTQSKFYFPYLQKSCIKNNIALEVIGYGQQWMGFAWRYKLMLEYLRKLQLYDIVCFIDGYDVISVRNLLELKNEFLKIKFRENCKIIVGHDKIINYFHEKASNFYFGRCKKLAINAGTYIGFVKDLIEIIEKIMEFNPDYADDDQILLTNYCIENTSDFYIDLNNEIFLTISSPLSEIRQYIDISDGNLSYNSNKPFFVHASGYGILDLIIHDLKIGSDYEIEKSDIKNLYKKNFINDKIFYYTKYIIFNYFLLIILICTTLLFFVKYNYSPRSGHYQR